MLGEKIKFLRKQKKMKQSDLADAMNITRSHISSIEINRTKPSYELLVKLADYFNVSLDYFYENQKPLEAFKQSIELNDPGTIERFRIFHEGKEMTTEDKIRLINYARFLMLDKFDK